MTQRLARPMIALIMALVPLAAITACSTSPREPAADAAIDADDSLIPGSTVVTTAPPEGPIPAVQEIEPDPADEMNADPIAPGATRFRFAYGPLAVEPGQNSIAFTDQAVPKPDEDGYIVRISPNLRNADGTPIPSDQVMFHHGVWLNSSRPDATSRLPQRVFAAGEEKTIATFPEGYGYQYDADDELTINYMLHNLTADPEQLWITYDIDFVPSTATEAKSITPTRPIWMDVQNGGIYPIFDVFLGRDGEDGTFTYPDDAAPDDPGRTRSEWTVDRDGVIVFGAGHLHAGGTSVDLFVRRGDEEVQIVNSRAEYFDPNGPVSWDVSMTSTPDDFRVAVKAGDVLRISTTYDNSRAAWYESMGIMVLAMADADGAPDPGIDPFVEQPDLAGETTHGQLPENLNYGGEATDLPDATVLPDGATVSEIGIGGFLYSQGDLATQPGSVPTVRRGESITFDNAYDAPLGNGTWHTITSCAAPCNKSTGISYPLADGRAAFDSGQLGEAGPPTVDRLTWSTPTDLKPGTYTYFCRIHPVMRGAFRVVDG